MNKCDWYIDRILWRANQHKLFEKACSRFNDLDRDRLEAIKAVAPDLKDPVLVFWDNEKKWTVLCALGIFSFFNDILVSSDLDSIDKCVSVVSIGRDAENIKKNSDFLRLDKINKLIWVPAGSELFALMSILRMFPLREPNN